MQRLTERIDNVPDGESGVWVKTMIIYQPL